VGILTDIVAGDEPILVKGVGGVKYVEVQKFVDQLFGGPAGDGPEWKVVRGEGWECIAMNPSGSSLQFYPIDTVYRHRVAGPMLQVELEDGRKVKVTKDHSLFTLQEGLIVPIKTSELKAEDYVVVPHRLPDVGFLQTPPFDLYEYATQTSMRINERQGLVFYTGNPSSGVPRYVRLSPDLAWVLGFWVAEGDYASKRAVRFSQSMRNKAKADELVRRLKNSLGVKPSIYIQTRGNRQSLTISLTRRVLQILFEKGFQLAGSSADQKEIPPLVWSLPRESKLEFIKGLIAGDGHIKKSKFLTLYSTKSEKLASQLSYLLFTLGFSNTIRKDKHGQFTIYIHGYEIRGLNPWLDIRSFPELFEVSGFGLFQRPQGKVSYTRLLWRVEKLLSSMKEIRKDGQVKRGPLAFLSKKGFVEKTAFGEYSLTEKGARAAEILGRAEVLLRSDVHPSKVKRITFLPGERIVYDFSVPGARSFVAGRFCTLMHNSDPWGAHIAMVIKSGSANSAHLRELTTPDAVWLGVWASVTGDEPVIMEIDGLMRNEEIGEVYSRFSEGRSGSISLPQSGRVNALCCTSEGRVGVMPVSALTRHAYDGDVFEFRTLGGYTVKTTANHSIEVFNPATYMLESRPASTLSEGDLVAACFRVPNNQSLRELNLAGLIASECPDEADKIFVEGEEARQFCNLILSKYDAKRLRRDFYQVLKRGTPKLSYFLKEGVLPTRGFLRLRYSRNTVPISVDVSGEFGRLLGYHTAEGNLGINGRGGLCELTFGGTEHEYVNDAVRCIQETFRLEATVRARKNRFDVRYGAKLLSTIFVKALRTGTHANQKRVPYVMFNAPNEVKKEFLRGCFRGDRMVNYRAATRLSLKTVSRRLACDLTVLLRQLGCVSYVWKGGDAFVVSCADVGPIQDVVDEVCRKLVSNRSEIRSMPGALVYPLRDEIKSLVSYGKKTQLHQTLFTNRGQTRVGYERLSNAFRILERPTQDERLKTLMNLVQNDVVLLPVKSIRNLGPTNADVYDLEVEGVHTFVGGMGGLVLHNSDIVKYKLPSDKLTEVDIKRLYELKEDPRYTDKMWHDELDMFLKIKKKSEQEAFSRYGLSYIVDTYLPEKLKLMKGA
jgi:intein/homing endonuclease